MSVGGSTRERRVTVSRLLSCRLLGVLVLLGGAGLGAFPVAVRHSFFRYLRAAGAFLLKNAALFTLIVRPIEVLPHTVEVGTNAVPQVLPGPLGDSFAGGCFQFFL